MEPKSTEYVRVEKTLDYDTELVWQVISDFGGIAPWISGVTACDVNGNGVGCIRTVSLGGRQVTERLHTWDPTRHVLAYQILPPHSLPASDILSTMELTAAGPASTRFVWRSEAVITADPAIMKGYIEPFFLASLHKLDVLLCRNTGK